MILVTIVSVSLNDDILEGIDKLQKTLGFTGRSEIVRAGIRNLLAEERMKQDLEGVVNSLLLAVHDEDSDDQVALIRHTFDKIINVHLPASVDGGFEGMENARHYFTGIFIYRSRRLTDE